MTSIHHNVLFGASRTPWCNTAGIILPRVRVYKDYDQPWHVIAPKNYTLRVRGPKRQYFFWIKRQVGNDAKIFHEPVNGWAPPPENKCSVEDICTNKQVCQNRCEADNLVRQRIREMVIERWS